MITLIQRLGSETQLKDDFIDALIEKIKDLNFEIAKDPSLGSGFCIGHSYFCGQDECTDEWMQSVVEYDILPMLEEYWFDEPAKIVALQVKWDTSGHSVQKL